MSKMIIPASRPFVMERTKHDIVGNMKYQPNLKMDLPDFDKKVQRRKKNLTSIKIAQRASPIWIGFAEF